MDNTDEQLSKQAITMNNINNSSKVAFLIASNILEQGIEGEIRLGDRKIAIRELLKSYNPDEEIEKLSNLIDELDEKNKKIVKMDVSEGILDWQFIKNPKTEAISLRLGRIYDIYRKERESQER